MAETSIETTDSLVKKEQQASTTKEQIAKEFLNSREETDQAGFKRKIYTSNEIEFSFRGKEELPKYPSTEKGNTILLGSGTLHIDPENYQEYIKDFRISEEVDRAENSTRHYLATKDVQGVIALSLELGAKDINLTEMLKEVKQGKYSGKTLDLIDKLLAANCVSDSKMEWKEELTGGDAEAVVVLALLGNKKANDYLDSKLEWMKELDKLRDESPTFSFLTR